MLKDLTRHQILERAAASREFGAMLKRFDELTLVNEESDLREVHTRQEEEHHDAEGGDEMSDDDDDDGRGSITQALRMTCDVMSTMGGASKGSVDGIVGHAASRMACKSSGVADKHVKPFKAMGKGLEEHSKTTRGAKEFVDRAKSCESVGRESALRTAEASFH